MSDNELFHVIEAEVNPTSAPPERGVHWINTVLKTLYFSTGTDTVADWTLQTSGILPFADVGSFPATGISGVLYLAEDTCNTYCWNGSAYVKTKADETNLDAHVANTLNPHSVTKAQVGLGNADNTSDITKNNAIATLDNKTIDGGAF